MRESLMPMKKVKANKTGTPLAVFLVFSMFYINQKAPTKKTTKPTPPDMARLKPVTTPNQAPRTVGTMLKANNQ